MTETAGNVAAAVAPSDVANEAKTAIVGLVSSLLEGAVEDLEQFAAAISEDLVIAMAVNNRDWMDRIVRQSELLAERHRVRAANGTIETFQEVLLCTIRFGAAALRAGLA